MESKTASGRAVIHFHHCHETALEKRRCRYAQLEYRQYYWLLCSLDTSEVVLSYTITHSSEDIAQHIPLTSISKPYGDMQYFYLCPSCGKRCMKLYLGSGRFYCRRCLGLNYRSTRRPEWLSACDKAWKLRGKLGPGINPLGVDYAERPRYMHWNTYYELKDRISDLYYGGMSVFLKMPVPDTVED